MSNNENSSLLQFLQTQLKRFIPSIYGTLDKQDASLPVTHDDELAALDPAVRKFRKYVESDADLMHLFAEAFEEIPNEFRQDTDGHGYPRIHDYRSMMIAIDRAIKIAPMWTSSLKLDCVIGCPINEALIWFMNTKTGSKILLREDVNTHFSTILKVWAEYLSTTASLSTLNDRDRGWLSKDALKELTHAVNSAYNSPFSASCFEDIFECQSSLPFYGFNSWDDFFTRRFRPSMRPVAFPDDDNIITNPCESQPFFITTDVQSQSHFDLKGTSYSLLDMFDGDESAHYFVGGTVYQGGLSVFNYHRWHAPISGKVLKISQIKGTYYAADPAQGFEKLDPLTKSPSPDRQAPEGSRKYLSSVATRTLMFIQADNEALGMVGFLTIGMVDISSSIATVAIGQHVQKGQEIGSFHYGGSSYCLIFGPTVKLQFSSVVESALGQVTDIGGRCIALNSELGRLM